MSTKLVRILALALGLTVFGIGPAAAEPPEPPEGFQYVADTQTVFLGIGCQRGDDGTTCSSTEYWLGKAAGDSSVGTTFTATPMNYLFHALGDDWSYADFFADDKLGSYVLRTDEPITGRIDVGGYLGGLEVAADSTVRVELQANKVGGGFVSLGAAEVNKVAVTPGDTVYDWEIELDPAVEGVEVTGLNLRLLHRSVTVLQNGFVDGQGGSYFELPHYDLVPIAE